MAVMLNKRVMLVMLIEPTSAVMVISQGATRTDGDEQTNEE
jgi:hypothetical protein